MTEPVFTTEELNSEEWRPIPGLNNYKVSNLGRVKGLRVPLLKPQLTRSGYLCVVIGKPQKPRLVHRLVMAAFHYPVSGRSIQVNHIDGNKANNRLSNLEYVTPRENWAHAVRIGLRGADFPEVKHRARGNTHYSRTKPEAVPRGSKHGRAKVTESMIPEIFRVYAQLKSYSKTAIYFGLGKTTISHIIKGDTWKHV